MADFDLQRMKETCKYQLAGKAGNFVLPKNAVLFHQQAREICDQFLTLACASLLSEYKPDYFFSNLARCAVNWQNFLMCHYHLYERHAPLRYTAPFHAAIISQEPLLIQGLLKTLVREQIPTEEYPAQIYKTRLLLRLSIEKDVASSETLRWLEKFKELTDEEESITMFTALADPQKITQAEFWEAFESALFLHETATLKKIKSVSTAVTRFTPHRYVWFEGLCWLHLALQYGYKLPSVGIKYCPDEALSKPSQSYANDWHIIRHDISLHDIEHS